MKHPRSKLPALPKMQERLCAAIPEACFAQGRQQAQARAFVSKPRLGRDPLSRLAGFGMASLSWKEGAQSVDRKTGVARRNEGREGGKYGNARRDDEVGRILCILASARPTFSLKIDSAKTETCSKLKY
jgi:hypothetical protein